VPLEVVRVEDMDHYNTGAPTGGHVGYQFVVGIGDRGRRRYGGEGQRSDNCGASEFISLRLSPGRRVLGRKLGGRAVEGSNISVACFQAACFGCSIGARIGI
jgi:hypothetical protein